jgi:hypothetical protein
MWLDAPELSLILSDISILATWRLWIYEHPLDLLRLIFRLRLHVIYSYMQKMVIIKYCNAWGAKYNMMHDQEHINPIKLYKLFY